MKRDEIQFIDDILNYIILIEESIKNLNEKEFKSDKLLIDATVRRFEIIGEAAKNISDKTKKRYHEVEWRKIAGFRDVMIHAYFVVDLGRVWKVIKNDLPGLKKKMMEIKKV